MAEGACGRALQQAGLKAERAPRGASGDCLSPAAPAYRTRRFGTRP